MISTFIVINLMVTLLTLGTMNMISVALGIKRDLNFFLYNIITVFATILAMHVLISFPIGYLVLAIVSAIYNIIVTLTVVKSGIKPIVITTALSFAFWPQTLCYSIFAMMHHKEILESEKL